MAQQQTPAPEVTGITGLVRSLRLRYEGATGSSSSSSSTASSSATSSPPNKTTSGTTATANNNNTSTASPSTPPPSHKTTSLLSGSARKKVAGSSSSSPDNLQFRRSATSLTINSDVLSPNGSGPNGAGGLPSALPVVGHRQSLEITSPRLKATTPDVASPPQLQRWQSTELLSENRKKLWDSPTVNPFLAADGSTATSASAAAIKRASRAPQQQQQKKDPQLKATNSLPSLTPALAPSTTTAVIATEPPQQQQEQAATPLKTSSSLTLSPTTPQASAPSYISTASTSASTSPATGPTTASSVSFPEVAEDPEVEPDEDDKSSAIPVQLQVPSVAAVSAMPKPKPSPIETLLKQVAEERTRTPDTPTQQLSDHLLALAEEYLNQGDYDAAAGSAQESAEQFKGAVSAVHAGMAQRYYVLARSYMNQGEHVKAEVIYKRDLKLRKQLQSQGEASADPTKPLYGLGELYARQKRYDESLDSYTQVLAIIQNSSDHTKIAECQLERSRMMILMGKIDDANKLLGETLEVASKNGVPETTTVMQALHQTIAALSSNSSS